jgi:hypothetical protein
MPNGCYGPQGSGSLTDVFINDIYGNLKTAEEKWRMTAAISGAHTLGGFNTLNTGADGLWSDVLNQSQFNNNYFQSILFKGWKKDTITNPDLGITRQQWKRADID